MSAILGKEEDPWSLIPDDIRTQIDVLENAKNFSIEKLEEIKQRLIPTLDNYSNRYTVVIAGSFGRREANNTSDLDAFVLGKKRGLRQHWHINRVLNKIEEIAEELDIEMASKGAFSDFCCTDDLLTIGGKKETNDQLTRRMLILAEGMGIYSERDYFAALKEQILDKYLQEIQPSDDRRPIFLINDLIRYYRTICVDYEYKKTEAGKPWAVKLTKLRHSRKLLYFSGLLPLLESMEIKNEERIDWLKEQFTVYTPLERLILLLKKHGMEKDWEILIHYNEFLKIMADVDLREYLDKISFDSRNDDTQYKFVRDNARRFRMSINEFVVRNKKWKESISKYVLS